nr:PREDICTED: proton-coupled amino acid transporter-like protein pathetic isoform X1 [Bemisia tabaci]XP_018911531.1 PREDICTED: proton-coupled amino acid transporter-like protein pathetic isoform X1 [Bemisia tabaci]
MGNEKTEKGEYLEKTQSMVTIDGSFNTSSTLKLTDNGTKKGIEADDTYEPFSNRDMTHATSNSGAFFHLLKSSLGSGILAMPNAFKNGGLIFGIVGTILTGIICTYCVHMLVICSQILSARVKKPTLGFAETAEVAFQTGPTKYKQWAGFAREFVYGALFATYYFGNTVYVVLIATSFKQVMDSNLGLDWDIRIYILFLALPLVPVGIIRTLKYLVPFSAMATVFIMVGLGFTIAYTLEDLPPVTSRHYFTSWHQLPLFFSTVLFAMEGIGTVIPIENSMKNPGHFLGCPGVLNIAMIIVVNLYGCVGFFGYLKYGDETKGSVTLNLPATALAESIKILVALSILFTYGLQFTVPTEIVWKRISHKFSEENQEKGYYIMRAFMILGTVVVASAVPNLSPAISLVGAICLSTLGLFCPAVIDTITFWEEDITASGIPWRWVKNAAIAIAALLALLSGTYASLIEMIHEYSQLPPIAPVE